MLRCVIATIVSALALAGSAEDFTYRVFDTSVGYGDLNWYAYNDELVSFTTNRMPVGVAFAKMGVADDANRTNQVSSTPPLFVDAYDGMIGTFDYDFNYEGENFRFGGQAVGTHRIRLYSDSGSPTNCVFTIKPPAGYAAFGWIVSTKQHDSDAYSARFVPGAVTTQNLRDNDDNPTRYGCLVPLIRALYTVTLDDAGGTGGSGSFETVYNCTTNQVTVPTRAGHTFAGYWCEENGTNYFNAAGRYAPETGWNISTNVTLTAHWSAAVSYVSLDLNGGEACATNTLKAVYGEKLGKLPVPTRASYTFVGWFTAAEGGTQVTEDTVVDFTSAQTYYAHWSGIYYTVTFDANGGTGATPAVSNVLDTAVTIPRTKPTRDYYEFAGWADSATAKTAQYYAGYDYAFDADQELFAVWTPLTYSFYYLSNFKDGYPDETFHTDGQDFKYGNTIAVPKVPSSWSKYKLGYSFRGWAWQAGSKSADYEAGDQIWWRYINPSITSTNLYAVWQANTYTVKFDANEGSGAMADLAMTYDVSTNLPACAFSCTGRTFVGWNTNAEGKGTFYAESAAVSNLTTEQGGIVTLYAQWSKTFYVTFEGNGATNEVPMDVQAMSGTGAECLASNSYGRVGYTFAGWMNETAKAFYLDGALYPISEPGSTNDLRAVWSPNTYTLRLEPNGGVGAAITTNCVYDQAFEVPACTFTAPDEIRHFVSWTNAEGVAYLAGAVVSNLTAAADAEVVWQAHWDYDPLNYELHCFNLKFYWEEGFLCAAITNSGTVVMDWQCSSSSPAASDFGCETGAMNDYNRMAPMTRGTTEVVISDPDHATWELFWNPGNVKLYSVRWLTAGSEPTAADVPELGAATGGEGFAFTTSSYFDYNLRGTNTLAGAVAEWPVLWTTNGTGGTISFPLRYQDERNMFYSVEVIKKQ